MPEQPEKASVEAPKPRAPRRRRSRLRKAGIVLLVLVAILGAVRLALPSFVRDYVNRTLDRDPRYDGMIGDVSLHLWRGVYSIEDVRIIKTIGNVPVPFFAARRLDFAIEWPALWSGEVVGRIVMEEPELNFVDADDDSQRQTGAGGPWLEMLRDLFPFDINGAEIHQGAVHFRAFQTEPPVDVYLSKLEGEITNLTNIHEDVTPLISTINVTGLAMDQAKVECKVKLDPFSYRPTFQLAVKLVGLDVTKLNALVRAYGKFDFESGWFDLVVELNAKEGRVEGYVKPLFRDLAVLDLATDLRGINVLNLFWQALVGGTKDLFKNQRRDQLATVIPLSGDLDAPRADVFAAIGNLLRNAFVRAYLLQLQGTGVEPSGITFGPGTEPDEAPGGE